MASLPPASPAGARGVMGNVVPHGKVNCTLAATFMEDPSTHASDPLVVLSHPGFRRLQRVCCGEHETTCRRLRFAGIFIFRYGAVRDRLPGLPCVEVAKLPDKQPQALGAL